MNKWFQRRQPLEAATYEWRCLAKDAFRFPVGSCAGYFGAKSSDSRISIPRAYTACPVGADAWGEPLQAIDKSTILSTQSQLTNALIAPLDKESHIWRTIRPF